MKRFLILLALMFVSSPLTIYATPCSKHATNDFIEMLGDPTKWDIAKLEKLYKKCDDNSVRFLLYLHRGDISESNKNTKKAFVEYKEAFNALNAIEAQDQTNSIALNKPKEYLIRQLDRYGVVDANEIERSYISRGGYDRGGKMVYEKKMKDLPLNFRTDSDAIERGVNLNQAQNIGKALSSPLYKSKVLYIRGFADTRGANSHNIALAQRRADSLKSYLKSKYNLDNTIVTENSGESLPICSKGEKMPDPYDLGGKKCSIREDYYASRRVEMTVGDQ